VSLLLLLLLLLLMMMGSRDDDDDDDDGDDNDCGATFLARGGEWAGSGRGNLGWRMV
jgi:hypothetical protein